MNRLYRAMIAAAEQIEKHPSTFNFNAVGYPGCGAPGCAIGWIGYFYGTRDQGYECYIDEVEHDTGIVDDEFYDLMDKYDTTEDYRDSWMDNAKTCADTLRLVAEGEFKND